MVNNNLNNIFLSASVPSIKRDPSFYDSADIIAIRDSVIALSTVVIPNSRLIWGGHPAITPLVNYVIQKMNVNVKEHITLYQSLFFEEHFPPENEFIENVRITEKGKDRDESLAYMRFKMFTENNFSAGIFIGGMEGVLEEYDMFCNFHPRALILPIASTGAAAKMIFDTGNYEDKRLMSDYAYMALFREMLKDFL